MYKNILLFNGTKKLYSRKYKKSTQLKNQKYRYYTSTDLVIDKRNKIRNEITIPLSVMEEQPGAIPDYNWKGVSLSGRSVYLDAQATTRVDPRVLDAMMPYLTEQFGNPHSRTHLYGWEGEHAVENARKQVANLIGANASEIIFTSGATESNNIAIKGVARFYKDHKKHVISTVIEHKCVLDSCRKLEQEGFQVTYLPVQKNGILDLKVLEDKLKERPDTSLVSIMAVNNEIGVIQPLKEIGAICRKYKTFFHTDAAQGVGKIPIDVEDMKIDLMSISAHKLYGPKGIGGLYIRKKPRVRVDPIQSGGGQERGIRSGTVPAPLVVGFGKACEIAQKEMAYDSEHAKKLYKLLYNKITSQLDEIYLNGDFTSRWHGNINLSFAFVEGESLLLAIREVACSSGSACTSASLEPSYVLRAIGVDEELAHTSLRIGIDRFTTEKEIEYASDLIITSVKKLRDLSPLYHMHKEGIDLKSIKWAGE
jgi:cysteine desulfurase